MQLSAWSGNEQPWMEGRCPQQPPLITLHSVPGGQVLVPHAPLRWDPFGHHGSVPGRNAEGPGEGHQPHSVGEDAAHLRQGHSRRLGWVRLGAAGDTAPPGSLLTDGYLKLSPVSWLTSPSPLSRFPLPPSWHSMFQSCSISKVLSQSSNASCFLPACLGPMHSVPSPARASQHSSP